MRLQVRPSSCLGHLHITANMNWEFAFEMHFCGFVQFTYWPYNLLISNYCKPGLLKCTSICAVYIVLCNAVHVKLLIFYPNQSGLEQTPYFMCQMFSSSGANVQFTEAKRITLPWAVLCWKSNVPQSSDNYLISDNIYSISISILVLLYSCIWRILSQSAAMVQFTEEHCPEQLAEQSSSPLIVVPHVAILQCHK